MNAKFIEGQASRAAQAFEDYDVSGTAITVESRGRLTSFVSMHCADRRYLYGSWEDVARLWAMFVEVTPGASLEVGSVEVVARNKSDNVAVVAIVWETEQHA